MANITCPTLRETTSTLQSIEIIRPESLRVDLRESRGRLLDLVIAAHYFLLGLAMMSKKTF